MFSSVLVNYILCVSLCSALCSFPVLSYVYVSPAILHIRRLSEPCLVEKPCLYLEVAKRVPSHPRRAVADENTIDCVGAACILR